MFRSALAVALAAAVSQSAAAAGPYDDLLKHAPANTNTLALIDVTAAFTSPLAKAEKWAEKGQPGNRGGLGFVPPDATTVVIATELNLSALTRDFQVGMVKVSRNVPEIREIAARENGTVDEMSGRLVVLSPRDVYFTSLPGSTFLAMYPADRQFTARYLRAVKAGTTGDLSPYLRKAADDAGKNTLTVAIDLEDAVDRTVLRMTLPSSPAVAKVKTVDVNLLASFLAGVKGLTFSAKVTDAITASITVEFAGEPTRFRITLPDLLRELIESQGIAIPGFEKWEPKFTDNAVTMSGPLTTADLRRIVSLFSFPQPPGEADKTDPKGNEPTAAMTRRYVQAVESILADVRSLRESPQYEKMATWHEKAAAQIEQLRRLGVDPVAADAGFEAAKRLRAIAQSLRGVPIDTAGLERQQYYYSSGGGWGVGGIGWWGRPLIVQNPTSTSTNIPQIQAQIAKVIAADQKKRLETWSAIDRIMIDARRKLTDKYKEQF